MRSGVWDIGSFKHKQYRRGTKARGTREFIVYVRQSGATIGHMYSAQLLDHFQNPRNAGELPSCDASVQVENPACGDVLRLSANIRGEKIADIRFKAKGCVPAMACGSAVTELLAGRTLAEAKALKKEDLVQAVGVLPEASTHAAHLALDALASLLQAAGVS